MSLSTTVLNQVLVMFGLMIIGIVAYKLKFINNDGKIQLTSLLLYIVNPFMVINSYQTEYNKTLAKNLLIAFALGLISHVVAMSISYIFVRKKRNQALADIERFAIIYSNCGFMAFPLIDSIYGNEGVFYASAYMTVFTILSWTHGYITLSGKADKSAIKNALLSPVIISVIIGLLIFFLKIKLPSVITSVISFTASLNTPIAMIVTGINLIQINILSAFKSLRCYYIVFLINILVPFCTLSIYQLFAIDEKLLIVNLIATACPCAVTTVLFSTKFNRNDAYATKLLTVSSLLSIFTIPLIILINQTFKDIL